MHIRKVKSWLFVYLLLVTGNVSAQQWVYTVVDGDTLWDLSAKYLHRVTYWKKLRDINRIENPRKMQPGTQLRLPLKWIRCNPVPAHIEAVQGQAELQRADLSIDHALTPGEKIRLGDRLSTDADSSVAVRFADTSLLSIHENSVVRFDQLSAYGDSGMVDTRLRLLSGRTDTRVRPANGPGSRFEIHTPSAISAVRGTRFRTAADDTNGSLSSIEVLEGKVAVSGADKTRLVPSGFGTQVSSGQAPEPPRALLPAPRIDALPEPIRQMHRSVDWQPLEGAAGYRIEISSDKDFATMLWERRLTGTRAPLPTLDDGGYFLRVRGIDERGLEGFDRTQRIVLDARPQPPVPLKPIDAKVIRAQAPTLLWSASAEAASYRLQVAADAAFSRLLVDETRIDTTRYTFSEAPPPGDYHWRIASIAADGEQGPMSPPRHWQSRAVPARPDVALAKGGEQKVVASWHSAGADQTYQVQMALDEEFTEVVLDEHVAQSSMPFSLISGQVRYLRVRGVEADGYTGPWGATQRIDPIPDDSWLFVVIPGILGILLL